jgi:hypothetical protein
VEETEKLRGFTVKPGLNCKNLWRWKGIFVNSGNWGGLFANLPGRPAGELRWRHVAGCDLPC